MVTSSQSRLKMNKYVSLDDDSNATLCTTRLMRRLQVPGKNEGMQISTIFGQRQQTIFKLDLNVKGVEKDTDVKNVYALQSLRIVSNNIVKEDIGGMPHLTGINFPTLSTMMEICLLAWTISNACSSIKLKLVKKMSHKD